MRVHHGLPRPRSPDAAGTVLAIGNFDGVHLGHQAMLAQVVAASARLGLPSTVLTFEPQPREAFAATRGLPLPVRITPLRDKVRALAACGVDRVHVLRFDQALARMTAEAFVGEVLVAGLGVRELWVGDDFRFGAGRAGDESMLRGLAGPGGYTVRRMDSFQVDGLRMASSHVRAQLGQGDMAAAALALGRPWSLSGHVLHGAKLGRNLGFRTLNLRFGRPGSLQLRPAVDGIFIARVHGLVDRPLAAVASMGVRPAVEQAGRVLLETHVLDWPAAELGVDGGYGRRIEVALLERLHGERPYPDLEALREGIADDVAAARHWWATLHGRAALGV